MTNVNLKPCPFCGGEAYLNDAWPHWAYCTVCGAKVQSVKFDEEGVAEATEKWNKRAFRIGRWKEVEGNYITPGGTPLYVCEQCGGGQHLHGVEYPEQALVCPKCGSINLYPWEKVRWLEDE